MTSLHLSNHFVLWYTGLPKSGKSHIAEITVALLAQSGIPIELIDSGKLRSTPLGATLGFSRHDRETNVRRHAVAANLLIRNGVLPVVSSVSPYRDVREAIRRELPNFIEIYVSTPKEQCIARDTTGTWQRALRGEIPNFTGVDDPYEAPLNPQLEVSLVSQTPVEAAKKVLEYLQEQRLFTPAAAASEDRALAETLSQLGYLEE
jgi:adenylylsulfate kinase